MNVSNPFQKHARLALLAAALALAACATTGDPSAKLGDRAQARWDALLAGDYESAHAYLSPGTRSRLSATDFEIEWKLRKIRYTSAAYQDHQCESDNACTVRVVVGYSITAPVRGLDKWESTSLVQERWVRTQGQWWFLPD